MTELQQKLFEYYTPNYRDIKETIISFSDEELNALEEDYPDDYTDLDSRVKSAIEWEIIDYLVDFFMQEDNFYCYHEETLMDYCDGSSLDRNYDGSYSVNFESVKSMLEDCISNDEEQDKWHFVDDIDVEHILSCLNTRFPYKFVK